MAWPSGTKASTANVDQGADLISLARPDIKQNIDNVNDIIDHLNISSPTNGDLLQYSSATGKWEQVTASSVGTQIAFFTLQGSNLKQGNYTNQLDLIQVTETVDSGNIATVTGDSGSNYGLQLLPGKYILGLHYSTKTALTSFELRVANEEDSVLDVFNTTINHLDDSLKQSINYLDTDIKGVNLRFEFDYNNVVVSDANITAFLQVTKIA